MLCNDNISQNSWTVGNLMQQKEEKLNISAISCEVYSMQVNYSGPWTQERRRGVSGERKA